MVQTGEVPEIVNPGEPPVQAALAPEDKSDPAAQAIGLPHHIMPQHARVPAGGDEQGCEHLHRGCFAGTVGPEQAKQFTRLHVKGDVFHRDNFFRRPPDDSPGWF